ncbi:mono-functional DNA-alkylating methyl methanesulfonate N-term-domain-containing protein [Xylariaceae sp. FL0255]|nr:mono-functional DNA-alkylating methyl methanesulfonate N-term-domain-containing protein [Xylariaceae sp. FL0255]
MASIQTQVFENNRWVTRTVDPMELLAQSRSDARPHTNTAEESSKPPPYGVLTKTVVPSPITRWILPVQLRASRYNDVALVGNRSVSICELDAENQLQPIVTKDDFEANIRNCQVLGSHGYLADYYKNGTKKKKEDAGSDIEMTDAAEQDTHEMFQQLLVLVLETGELVFAFLERTSSEGWAFVTLPGILPNWGDSKSKPKTKRKPMIKPETFQMAISPTGEYLVLSYAVDQCIVCQLEPLKKIRLEYYQGREVQLVREHVALTMRGVIQTLDFLYPGPGKESQVIMVLISTNAGISRLATYEWDRSESLRHVLRSDEISGHRLEEAYRFPLLVIPLTVGPQFIIVTETATAVCSNLLSGPPTFAPFPLANRGETSFHFGTRTPLWTAWARPIRHQHFHKDTDVIYLAREDGWLCFLEISDGFGIEQSVSMGPLDCNIDSAFACVVCLKGDVVLSGGDVGPVSIWSVAPRDTAQHIRSQHNWSPSTGIVLVRDPGKNYGVVPSDPSGPDKSRRPENSSTSGSKNDRSSAPGSVFVCGGRGKHGAVTELRYGIEAKIGLDLVYSSPIKRCWTFPDFDGNPGIGFLMLLTLPDSSALLHISHEFTEVAERSQSTVQFDLLSPTLAVYTTADLIIQVTQTYATIVSPTACYQHMISDLILDPQSTVTNAAIASDTLALATFSFPSSKLLILGIDEAGFSPQVDFHVEGEITSISVDKLSNETYVLVGLWINNYSILKLYPTRRSQSLIATPIEISLHKADSRSQTGNIERTDDGPITSIVCSSDDLQNALIIIGTRNGDVVKIQGDLSRPSTCKVSRDQFGLSSSDVFTGPQLHSTSSVLVCNDSGLAIMECMAQGNGHVANAGAVHRVWLTDANERGMSSPVINSVSTFHEDQNFSRSTVVMVSGAQILLTELQPKPTAVPRTLSLEGNPMKMLYSERLNALVTVFSKDGVISLHFIDPLTGKDLSRPKKKEKKTADKELKDVDYIDKLGHRPGKIVSLNHWRPNSRTNTYFCLTIGKPDLRGGIIVLVHAQEASFDAVNGTHRGIQFWTVHPHIRIAHEPLRAITTDNDTGIFAGVGNSVQYHKFGQGVPIKCKLPSPAMSMELVGGNLQVTTARHSLVVLAYETEDTGDSVQKMTQLQTDVVRRDGLSMIAVGITNALVEQDYITLVSDAADRVYGLHVSYREEPSTRPELAFTAELSSPVRMFMQGQTRPRWATKLPCHPDHLQHKLEANDIFGLSVDGSLVHFSILTSATCSLLDYFQNLYKKLHHRHELNDEYDSEEELDPEMKMHIDGDKLKRLLETRGLLGKKDLTDQQMAKLKTLVYAFEHESDSVYMSEPQDDEAVLDTVYRLVDHYLCPAV